LNDAETNLSNIKVQWNLEKSVNGRFIYFSKDPHSHGSKLTVESEARKGSTISCPGSGNINAAFFFATIPSILRF
jgi:hypothetical protein